MSGLTGPLYSRVLHKIQGARPTGTATNVSLFQQRVCVPVINVCAPRIYHVGLLAESESQKCIFEHGPVTYDISRTLLHKDDTIFIALPSVRHTLEELIEFEKTLPHKYVVGLRDCRHHVLDILDFLYY
jgi:hypothetical protein